MRKKVSKHDQEFMELLKEKAILNRETGNLRFDGMYVSTVLNFCWRGNIIAIPHSHVVWFLEHGRWPNADKVIDHRDDDAMNNVPDNLQELTHAENQRKRRGRIVYRSYGKGKYGYGINLRFDHRDSKWYVTRYMSRGHGKGDLKDIVKNLGSYPSEETAKAAIAEFTKQIRDNGLSFSPSVPRARNRITVALENRTPEIRALRKQGKTYTEIKEITGFSEAALWKICKDIEVDTTPRGADNQSAVYTEDQIRQFKVLRRQGATVAEAARQAGIGKSMSYQIDSGHRWGHVQ